MGGYLRNSSYPGVAETQKWSGGSGEVVDGHGGDSHDDRLYLRAQRSAAPAPNGAEAAVASTAEVTEPRGGGPQHGMGRQ